MSSDDSLPAQVCNELSIEPTSVSSVAAKLSGQHPELAEQVGSSHPDADRSDADPAVDAGMLVGAYAANSNADSVAISQQAATTAVATAEAAERVGQHTPPLSAPMHYSRLGGVIPVLPGSAGAGASTVAAALADALQLLSWRVLLIDTADSARSGLSSAAHADGSVFTSPYDTLRIRFSWRGQALLASLETSLPVLAPSMVPSPEFWIPPMGSPQFTVVDLSYDAWRMAACPLAGPGLWLRAGQPPPTPLLVVRPSRPSLAQAEQALARLETWIAAGVAVSPATLVVVGAKRWPAGVSGSAGRRTAALLDSAIFLPHDPVVAAGGISSEVVPARLLEAIRPLLSRWRLLPQHFGPDTRRRFRKGNWK